MGHKKTVNRGEAETLSARADDIRSLIHSPFSLSLFLSLFRSLSCLFHGVEKYASSNAHNDTPSKAEKNVHCEETEIERRHLSYRATPT